MTHLNFILRDFSLRENRLADYPSLLSIIREVLKMWSGYVYDKDGNQINWLDSWSNKQAMIRCAKEHPKFHSIKIYKTPDYFKDFKTSTTEAKLPAYNKG